MSTDLSILMRDWLSSMKEPDESLPDDLEAAFRGPLHPLLLGADSGERATCLLFRPGHSRPALVLKLARTEPGRRALKNEYQVLCTLRGHVSDAADRFFPLAVGFHDSGGFAGLVQEAAPGETWFRRLRTSPGMEAETGTRLAQVVLERLSVLGDLPLPGVGVPSSAGSVRADWASCVDELAGRLDAPRLLTNKGKEVLHSLKQKIRSVDTFPFQHGDLFPKNILLPGSESGEHMIVIDWGEAGRHLPPLFDMVLLLSTLWFEHTGPLTMAERTDHFRRVFWESTGLENVREEAFDKGWERWDLGSDWRREDAILLALSVYARRIASLYGPDHGEMEPLLRNVEYTLSKHA